MRILNTLVAAALAILLVAHAPGQSSTTKSTSKTTAKATAKTSAAKTKTAAKAPVRYRQVAPTPQRYREIQQALADKGYFQGDVDGNWGPDSVDAMKRFQHDKNLTDDGKLSSLSLIGLGLGSEHGTIPPPSPTPNPVAQQ